MTVGEHFCELILKEKQKDSSQTNEIDGTSENEETTDNDSSDDESESEDEDSQPSSSEMDEDGTLSGQN